MIIFIRNIPKDTHINELYEYVEPELKRSFPFTSGKIRMAKIIAIRDKRTNVLEFHGIVQIDNEKSGRLVIKKLKGKRFKNKFVIVKEYFIRDWHHDRRLMYGDDAPDDIVKRRTGDRRRGKNVELISDISSMFRGVNASRKSIDDGKPAASPGGSSKV